MTRVPIPDFLNHALNGLAIAGRSAGALVILEPINNRSPDLRLIPRDPALKSSAANAKSLGNYANLFALMQPKQCLCPPNLSSIAAPTGKCL